MRVIHDIGRRKRRVVFVTNALRLNLIAETADTVWWSPSIRKFWSPEMAVVSERSDAESVQLLSRALTESEVIVRTA